MVALSSAVGLSTLRSSVSEDPGLRPLFIRPARPTEQPAIHPNCLPRNELGGIARQEHDGAGDIHRLAHAAEWREFGPRGGVITGFELRAFDLDSAWRDAIDGDPVLAQLDRRHPGEHLDAALAGGVIDQ